MRRLFLALTILGPLVLATGCAYSPPVHSPAKARLDSSHMPPGHTAPVIPPPGFIFSQVRAPLSTNYHNTPANPGKMGESRSLYIWIPIAGMLSFAWMEDTSLAAASRAGGLTEIEYADYEIFNVLGIFQQFTITAYGR
jgi:hypothetical protein